MHSGALSGFKVSKDRFYRNYKVLEWKVVNKGIPSSFYSTVGLTL